LPKQSKRRAVEQTSCALLSFSTVLVQFIKSGSTVRLFGHVRSRIGRAIGDRQHALSSLTAVEENAHELAGLGTMLGASVPAAPRVPDAFRSIGRAPVPLRGCPATV